MVGLPHPPTQGTAPGHSQEPFFIYLASPVLGRCSHFLEMAEPPSWTADLGGLRVPPGGPQRRASLPAEKLQLQNPKPHPDFSHSRGPSREPLHRAFPKPVPWHLRSKCIPGARPASSSHH